MVGFAVVLQHNPLAVTDAPPSFETIPPLIAEFIVIFVTAFVVKVGITGSFLQLSTIVITITKQTKIKRGNFFFIQV